MCMSIHTDNYTHAPSTQMLSPAPPQSPADVIV